MEISYYTYHLLGRPKNSKLFFERDKTRLLEHTQADIIVEKATLETLQEQLKYATVIFVCGGNVLRLKESLLAYPDFSKLIKGKVYVGASAGANLLAHWHTSYFSRELQPGLGILPINLMAHYSNPEFNATAERIAEFSTDHELILLPECEWQVFEVEE